MCFKPRRFATNRSLIDTTLHCPLLNPAYQCSSDTLPLEIFIHDQSANFHPVVRFQKLREKPVNPSDQQALRRFSYEHHVVGAGKQALKPKANLVFRCWITELCSKACYPKAVLLLCVTDGTDRHVSKERIVFLLLRHRRQRAVTGTNQSVRWQRENLLADFLFGKHAMFRCSSH